MSDPTLDQVAPGGIVNLNNAPSPIDDATFDSLFPADGTSQVTAPQAPQNQPGQPTAPSAPAAPNAPAPAPSAPFIKGSKSVYNTAEAAVEGINAKDALIEQLRTRYALTTGIDPITGQPVQAQNTPPQNNNYYENPQKYLDDLYKAAKEGGPQAYRDVQAQFMLDTLSPLTPMINRMAREEAIGKVSTEIKDVASVIGTPAYQAALDANPDLKEAINTAESDFRFHSRLPGLYKIAYFTSKGTQLPEILRANATQVTPNLNSQPQNIRPTAQPSTPAPPQRTAPPSLRTIEGIRATIADAESRGAKLDF